MKFLIKYSDICRLDNNFIIYLKSIISDINKIYILIDDKDYSNLSTFKQEMIVKKYKKILSNFPFTTIILKQDSLYNIMDRNHLDILLTNSEEKIDDEFIACVNLNDNPEKQINDILIEMNKPILEDAQITDKPSEDKVWFKYYNKKALSDLKRYSIDKSALYTHIYNQNKDFLYDVAFICYGNEVTYDEFFKNVEKYQKSFLSIGVQCGDSISICTPNVLAGIYAYYAAQNIGAIPSPLHVYTKANVMKKYFEDEKTKYIVMIGMQEVYESIDEAIKNNSNIEKVIVVPLNAYLGFTSLESVKTRLGIALLNSKFGKILTNMNKIIGEYKQSRTFSLLKDVIHKPIFKMPISSRYILLDKFLEDGKNQTLINSENKVSTMIHTGGTTGIGKSTILSHNNINSNEDAFEATIQDFERGDTIITIPPMFHILGLNNCISLILRNGGKIVLISKYRKKELPELFKKYHPELFFCVPKIGKDMNSINNFGDLSHLKHYVMGGEEMSMQFIDESYEFLKSNGAKIDVSQSLGGTEGSCSYTNTFANCNVHGSIGIPLINLDVKIVKEESGQIIEVGYNEYGEICFHGDSIMVGYLNDEEANAKTLKKHDDGKIWLHTGDCGYINNDGILFFVDRIKDMIKINGEQVYPSEIKKVVLLHPSVKDCAAICIENNGKKRMIAVITLKNNSLESQIVITEVLELCKQNLQKESIPLYIDVRESLPETNLFKIDNVSLTKEYISKQKKLGELQQI